LSRLLDDSKHSQAGQPFFVLGNLKMSEIIDDELGRVPDADIWELFTGRREPAALLENGQFRLIHPITQGEFEVIRDTVSHSVSVFGNSDHLLRLMWIRESKFCELPLHDDNLLAFFASVFAICDYRVSAEEIWQFGIGELMNSGFVERKDTKLGKKRVQSYHLSIAGRKRAEKWFDKQIRKTGQFNNAPYLPEKRLDEAIAPLPVIPEPVQEQPEMVVEQGEKDIADIVARLAGRWVSQKDFLDRKGSDGKPLGKAIEIDYDVVDLPAWDFTKLIGGAVLRLTLGILHKMTSGNLDELSEALKPLLEIANAGKRIDLAKDVMPFVAKVFAVNDRRLDVEQMDELLAPIFTGRREI